MISDLTSTFRFPVGKTIGDDADTPTFQDIHDLAVLLGATCTHCAVKSTSKQAKALDRVATSAAVMARARKRRFALAQDLNAAVAATDTPPQ